MKYDFGGWATRNDLQCADGRVIKKDAFKGQNGQTVPLVWMHNHADPANVLGLAHSTKVDAKKLAALEEILYGKDPSSAEADDVHPVCT